MQTLLFVRRNLNKKYPKRSGAIAPLSAILLVPLLGIAALAVDYAYLLNVRTELQQRRCAALAAVRDLTPSENGSPALAPVRQAIREYCSR